MNIEFKKFTKEQRSTFEYWFWHWLAFNYVAVELNAWKFKYLFHDIEKPWLKLFWGDYNKVQQWHRHNNRHHIEYSNTGCWDVEAMIIDWECSGLTKVDAKLNAREEYERLLSEVTEQNKHTYRSYLIKRLQPKLLATLEKFNL